ncbi:isoleucine--tRNA ligase [Croceimicrobium sp.]|uniref:isoleucine--tRNA ligase n=1 Tax=Croceimicrobium sp. TaxID=2828340 RepID=UPI003BA897F4
MSRKYQEYKHLNLAQINQEILQFWKEDESFKKSISSRDGAESFVFYEGPPSANGKPGIHHVMGRAIKDIFCRFKTLQGYQVNRKAGWDTHGLPVELGVEKELGITKEDIGKSISVEEYNEACKKAVMRYTDIWNELTEKMGYWVDMDDPYVTYRPKYMESVWWLLKQLWDKELIYKGYTIQPYSPKAGTGLSSHELNMPGSYRDVKDTSAIAQFIATRDEAFQKVFGDAVHADDLVYYIAWTTTPWTLPSNTALTVGPKIEYQMIDSYNPYTGKRQKVVLAKNLVSKYFKPEGAELEMDSYETGAKVAPWRVVWEGIGRDLENLRYEQLLDWALPYEGAENAFRIILGDFVTTEDGTGIVHTAPTFGADDAKVAKEANPPVPPMLVLDQNQNPVPLVDLQGRFREGVGPYAGFYVKNEYYADGEAPEKSVDVEISILLKERNQAFKVEKYSHSYPHCWRTDKPILYYPLDSWFIRVSEEREKMVALNKTINWKPKSTGEGRFGNWLENANDWNLSRSRYWGIPLPIWSTEDGNERRIFGSVAELKEACDQAVAQGLMEEHPFANFNPEDMSDANYDQVDLHRHIVDKIILASPSGKPMRREADLIDVWFDSGSMPYAQWHYPFENKDKFDSLYPADFIAEGVDQTRGWFYTLHAIASLVFDKVAYKNVVSNGLVLDKDGAKMSKRLGNAIDPFETIEKYGSDPVRWYMISNASPWDNLKFDLDGVAEVQRRFFGTLYNTYNFFALYANIDGFAFDESQETAWEKRPELDRWILSRLQELIANVEQAYADYEPTKAARAIEYFVDEELSNWYVRLNRRRFWKGDLSEDKQMAYETLYRCLRDLAQLISPIAPFFADRLYQDLDPAKGESVHLSYWPKHRKEAIDSHLNERMATARNLSSMVLSLRKKERIKVRQPLQKIMVPALSDDKAELLASIKDILLAEVNVKELEVLREVEGVLVKSIKPDFKKLGPRFGKQMKQVAAAIRDFDQAQISELESNGAIDLELEGEKLKIELNDVEIHTEDIPGWLVMSENKLTVALDIHIDEALRLEGIARELVNRIQNLRKDSGLEVTDRIQVQLQRQEMLERALSENESYVKAEVLADSIEWFSDSFEGEVLDFDDIQSKLSLKRSH